MVSASTSFLRDTEETRQGKSNLIHILVIARGWHLLLFEVSSQWSRSFLNLILSSVFWSLACISHTLTFNTWLQGVRFDPDLPQTLRLEFAKSNTKVTKPKQQSPQPAATHPTLIHPITGRKSTSAACIIIPSRQCSKDIVIECYRVHVSIHPSLTQL